MRNVRKDTINKLISGLNEKREIAKGYGASIPKTYHYHTRKTTNWIWLDEEHKEYCCSSELYDGTKCFTLVKF